MPRNNLKLGRYGEKLARDYLRNHGYQIIEINFQKRYGEIDIIAREKDVYVFVEVKCRKGSRYGNAREAITPWKLRSLIHSIEYYQLINHLEGSPARLDLIAIDLDQQDNPLAFNHLQNISS